MSRTLLRLALPVALAAAVLAGCAVPSTATGGGAAAEAVVPELAADQKVSISWETYNLLTAGASTDAVHELVSRFEALHPNITVTARAPQGTTSNLTQSVQREVVAGTAPDVAQLTFSDLRYIASDLGAQNLDTIVGRDAVQRLFTDGPHPHAPRAAVLGQVDGVDWGIPYVFSTPVLFYNADLFKAAGLDPDKPPTTWAEVQQDAQAITAATPANGVYVGCVDAAAAIDWCLQGIVRSAGGRVLSPDAKTLTWADPPAVDAVSTLAHLVQSGPRVFPNSSATDAQDSFQRGQLGMFLNTSALQGSLIKASTGKFTLRAAGLPGFGTGPAVPTNSGSALFVMSKDPAKQRAAWDLISYLTSPDAQTLITQKIGYVPLRSSLVDDPQYLKSFADTQRGLIAPNIAQLDRLEPWVSFPGPDYTQIRTLYMKAVEQVVFHGADPTATLAAAQQQASGLMPR